MHPQKTISLITNKSIILYISKPLNQQNVTLINADVLENSHYKGFSLPASARPTYVLEEYYGKDVIHSVSFVFPEMSEKGVGTSGLMQAKETSTNPFYAPRLFLQVPLHEDTRFRVRNLETGMITLLSDSIIQNARKFPQKITTTPAVTFYDPDKRIDHPVLGANSDNDGYFDLLIMSDKYTDFTQFSSDADAIAATFFATQPYASLKSKIRVKKMNNTADLGCHYNQWQVYLCDPVKVAAAAGQTSYNHVLVVSKYIQGAGIGGWTEWGIYAVVTASVTTPGWLDVRRISMHELGHLIGWLSDEYEIQGGGLKWDKRYYLGPNCDPTPGCPKWNTVSGTSCIASCSFTDVYRSTYDSLMKGLDTGNYNAVSVRAITSEINKFSQITPSVTPSPTPVPATVTISGQVYCLNKTTGAHEYAGLHDIKITSGTTSWSLATSDAAGYWTSRIRADLLNGASIRPDGGDYYPKNSTPDQYSGVANGITCTDSNLESIRVDSLLVPKNITESTQCKRTLQVQSLNFNLGYCNVPARATSTPEPLPYTHVDIKNSAGQPGTMYPPGFISNACWGGQFVAGRISSSIYSTGSISSFDAQVTNDAPLGQYCGVMIKPPTSNYVILGVTPAQAGFVNAGVMTAPNNNYQQGNVYGWDKTTWYTGKKNMTVIVTTLTPSPTITPAPTITGTPRTWNVTLKPLCSDGSISKGTYRSQFMNTQSGKGYETGMSAPGQQIVSMFDNSIYQATVYFQLLGADGNGLKLSGTPVSGMYYDNTGILGQPSAAWYNDVLPAGAYTINFVAPISDCTSLSPTPTSPPAVVAQKFNFEAQTGTMTLYPTADTFVDKSLSTTNYGTSSTIKLDSTVIEYGFMKFDLTPLAGKTIVSAKLKLYFTNATTGDITVKTIADTSWTETGLTYAKMPSLTSLNSTVSNGAPTNAVKEFDITPLVVPRIGKVTTFVLSVNSNDGADFRSNNSSTNKPVLEIHYK